MSKPKVSIITISYNQERYIDEALKSMVNQKADFDFEILVADDGSTDKTRAIISEYAKAYPNIVKPLFRKKNLGSWENFVDAIQQAKGTYIALCEGDDYWTDDTKLQQQADFLDNNNEYALCFHPVRVFFENKQKPDVIFPASDGEFTVEKLLSGNFIQTNSIMYRARKDYNKLAAGIMPGDWYLHLFHAQSGKIGFLDKVMSAYRRHEEGLWWDEQNDIEKLWLKNGIRQLRMFDEVLKLYEGNDARSTIIKDNAAFLLDKFIDLDKRHHSGLFAQAVEQLPRIVEEYAKAQLTNIRQLFDDRERLKVDLAAAEQEIRLMKGSRIWKTGVRLQKLKPRRGRGEK